MQSKGVILKDQVCRKLHISVSSFRICCTPGHFYLDRFRFTQELKTSAPQLRICECKQTNMFTQTNTNMKQNEQSSNTYPIICQCIKIRANKQIRVYEFLIYNWYRRF